MTRTTLALLMMMSSGGLVRADLLPIGFISIDTGVPIGGIDTIGVGNLTGLTYGCSFPAGFQVCTDLTISGSMTFQFQNGGTVDTTIVPLVGVLGPGFYDPAEFQFLDSATLLSATFAGTISPRNFDVVLADGSISAFTASPDILSSSLTTDQPIALLQVDASPVPTPEVSSVYLALTVAIVLIGLQRRHRIRSACRGFSSSRHNA